MEITLAVLSLLGTAVFAASGALVAAEQRFDLIGATFLSVAAGLGGGTLVDLLIGAQVRWLTAPEPLWAALASGILVFEVARFGRPPHQTLAWADAIGLALFTATGAQRLTMINFDPAVTVFLTTIGAAGGGIVRDVLANRPPLVFSGEIYVTASLLGALVYYVAKLAGAEVGVALAGALIVTFAVRAAGIVFQIRLPPGGIGET
ncbi:MAG: trimeric intracellular cation channel family protein [Alphaproteobacteria bacterium]|nr:trimeric intracellular cation channel family protein [Alphaproteobacteria bacterium]